MTDLVPLCRNCHQEVTDIYNKLDRKSNELLWDTTTIFIIDKRKSGGLPELPAQFFSSKLMQKPHNVIGKVLKNET
jgi:hypothetical protein